LRLGVGAPPSEEVNLYVQQSDQGAAAAERRQLEQFAGSRGSFAVDPRWPTETVLK